MIKKKHLVLCQTKNCFYFNTQGGISQIWCKSFSIIWTIPFNPSEWQKQLRNQKSFIVISQSSIIYFIHCQLCFSPQTHGIQCESSQLFCTNFTIEIFNITSNAFHSICMQFLTYAHTFYFKHQNKLTLWWWCTTCFILSWHREPSPSSQGPDITQDLHISDSIFT